LSAAGYIMLKDMTFFNNILQRMWKR